MTNPFSDVRLFGIPGAEDLHTHLASAYEAQIEPDREHGADASHVIEEWSVEPPIQRIPSACCIVNSIIEQTCDTGPEDMYDRLEDLESDPVVVTAAEALRQAIAARITYYVADKRVASHVITWDDKGKPLDCGKPMYVRSS